MKVLEYPPIMISLNEEIFFSSIVEWISKFFKRNLWIKVRYALVCT